MTCLLKHLIILSFLFWCSRGQAQESILERPISVSFSNISQQEALNILESITGLNFAYPSNLLNKEKLLTEKWENEKLDNIIRQIFRDKNIELKVLGSRLLIKELQPPNSSGKKTLNGYIKDRNSGEMLIGASVYLKNGIGTSTNAYGFFSLSLDTGFYELIISYLGYESVFYPTHLTEDQRKDFMLQPSTSQLEMVLISSKDQNIDAQKNTGSRHQLSIPSLKKLPAIGGEPDLFKSIQLLPGVGSAGEGSAGLYVRGGNIDQNLIILDEAPIYNPSHLLGFFSTFHPDAIKHLEIFKGQFPARYGGRLSSVVELRMKEGNKEALKVQGGIGLLASRLLVEGPIQKDRHSFMLAARRTYPDLFLRADEDDGGNKVNFMDLNFKSNWQLNNDNRLFLSVYNGQDVFRYFDAYENQWGNTTATLRWNRLFDEKTFANFSFVYSRYQYRVENIIDGQTTFNWTSGITDYHLKADFTSYLDTKNRLEYGTQQILHQFNPGQESKQRLQPIPESKTLEQAFYFGHHKQLSQALELTYGLRLSAAHNLGRNKVFEYDDDFNIIDSASYQSGIFHSQILFSPRLHLQLKSGAKTWWNAGYSRTVQYLFQLRNTTTAFNAFYTFMPSNPNIPAQAADQLSLGILHKNPETSIQWSVEAYYKWLYQQVDFTDHAQLLQNPYVESQLRLGSGRAYGLEAFIQKSTDFWDGSLSYSYSRSFKTISGINEGREYPTYYDQPHAVKLWLHFKPASRWEWTLNWQLISGRATTLPIGSFQYEGTIVPIYEERNSSRLPTFHRLDLAITLNSKEKKGKDRSAYWVLTVFNVYNRKNALAIDILPKRLKESDNVPDALDVAAFKTYVSGILPSLSYNFRF